MLERLRWGSSRIALPFLSSKHQSMSSRAPTSDLISRDPPCVPQDSKVEGQGRRPFLARAFLAVRKMRVSVIGFVVLVFGVALIVLPGPAILVIPLGLNILAKQFSWAQKVLGGIKGLRRRRVTL
jgi:hypothetical protein